MSKVIKHTTNNLVTVSYPIREAVLDITHAEHALILAFSTQKVQMIKFIRNQYNIGLYEAKQVVDTVIASYENVESVQKDKTMPATDWSTVPKGTMIHVRDYDELPWEARQFISYSPENQYGMPFICRHSCEHDQSVNWKFGKLISV
jgi:hypothetical protein